MPIYLVIAYIVFWLCTFALLLSIWDRQRRIEREIGELERHMEADWRGDNPNQDPTGS